MGMYTGIRFKGFVKPEFREDFEDIALHGQWEDSNVPKFKQFGQLGRAGFIPCGCLSYMPDEWETNPYQNDSEATDGFNRTYDKETGYWTFQCSLKNYESEIEQWFDMIPLFIESIEHLEYLYEEWEYSSRYDIVNGNVIIIEEKFIQYRED